MSKYHNDHNGLASSNQLLPANYFKPQLQKDNQILNNPYTIVLLSSSRKHLHNVQRVASSRWRYADVAIGRLRLRLTWDSC